MPHFWINAIAKKVKPLLNKGVNSYLRFDLWPLPYPDIRKELRLIVCVNIVPGPGRSTVVVPNSQNVVANHLQPIARILIQGSHNAAQSLAARPCSGASNTPAQIFSVLHDNSEAVTR
jgi:hypothetical protein